MKEIITRKDVLNEAYALGAVLGIIPVCCQLINYAVAGAGAFIVTLVSFVLWAAKFGGCIYLMRWWMVRLCSTYDEVTNKDTRRLGVLAALFSALIIAAWTFADTSFIHSELYQQSIDSVFSQYSSMLDSNSTSMLQNVRGSMGYIGFFSNFIYCFLFGYVLSVILSSRIPSRNPFADVQD
ncbi:MAG: hypothetical protein HUJ94_05760 [Bacteroidales bacterium]|nr:hypothetical protein [Bacteroidales bacterium]